ncbi:CvfB family protein [Paenibacillus senegalensis]|uniref:CvfB family protein n=1 Tax=Paenibacillus senegalensis TaxID=1465766 RepID=UPI000288712F|nr:S1-like domain-containing RNA-binding protein [Paenibacillus senegalensis]
MTMYAGEIQSLEIAREVSPYGYFLTDGERDVLLPYGETDGEVRPGQYVDVFLYHDTQDRLTATMKQPLLRWGETGLLEVADIHPRYGSFLEMGIGRQVLLPFREQPDGEDYRPQVGDKVYAVLDRDRQGRLIAKLAGEEQLAKRCFRAPESWKNEWKTAIIYNTLQIGSFAVVDGGVLGFGCLGFIHASERPRPLRVGEQVQVRITHVREDGRVNLSLKQPKQVSQIEDADRILAFLQERPNGAMPYSDQTPADIIMAKFQISKSAFKRALGKLMKEGKIEQKDNWTYLVQASVQDQTEEN